MPRLITQYVCQQCGVSQPKWSGQCPNCKAWNSLVEEVVERQSKSRSGRATSTSRSGGGQTKLVRMSELQPETSLVRRWGSGLLELDRVLGGGVVPGSVVLVAGEPGIGKSTLLTQVALMAQNLTKPDTSNAQLPDLKMQNQNLSSVMYVCGEETQAR